VLFDPPLTGVRVADFSQGAAGGLAGQMLRELGAEVVKCEPSTGEWSRHLAPRWGDTSAVFAALNGGKQSVVVDLRSDEGRAAARALCLAADVVIESMRPGKMAALGLGYEELAAERPALVYCSITGFGQDGPWAGRAAVDVIGQAAGGLLSQSRTADGQFVKPPLVADFSCGMLAAYGIVAALVRAREHGQGDHVDASLLAATMTFGRVQLAGSGDDAPSGSDAGYAAPNGVFRAGDGSVAIAANFPRKWIGFCEALGMRDLLDDERFATEDARVVHAAALRAEIERRLAGRPVAEVVEALAAHDVPAAAVLSIGEVSQTPQGRLAGRLATTTRDDRPPVVHMGAGPHLRRSVPVPCGPEPSIGEHDPDPDPDLRDGAPA
jgi:crotonobetainyl-CoA:carnitine CoA-transferase CaiB-like acyl-CoA transferase